MSLTKPKVDFDSIIGLFTINEVDLNEIPVTDPIKHKINVPMGLVDPTQERVPESKKIILRLGLKKDSKRKESQESIEQPMKKLKDRE